MSSGYMSGYYAGVIEGVNRMTTKIRNQHFPVSGAFPNLYRIASIHEDSIDSIRQEVLNEFRRSEKVVTDEYIISHWNYIHDEAKAGFITSIKARMMVKLIEEHPDAQYSSISFEVGPLDDRTKEVYFESYMNKMGTAYWSSGEEALREHIDNDYRRVVMHVTIHENEVTNGKH